MVITKLENEKELEFQKDVLNYLANGYNYAEISKVTGASKRKISALVQNLYAKYDIHTRPGLICRTIVDRVFEFIPIPNCARPMKNQNIH